jgi:hypothetical protein
MRSPFFWNEEPGFCIFGKEVIPLKGEIHEAVLPFNPWLHISPLSMAS